MNTYTSPSLGTGTILSETEKATTVDFAGRIVTIEKKLNKKSIKQAKVDAFFNAMTPTEMAEWERKNDAKNAYIKSLAKY